MAVVKRKPGIALLLAAVALLLPLVDRNAYHIDVLATAGLYAILALGLNLIVGYAGLLHLGYAAFFAIGAYTYALLNLRAGWPFWWGLPAGAVAAGIVGVLLGVPAIVRVRGDYLAIVTLGFGEIVRIAFTNLGPWTGGPNGLLGIDHPTIVVPGIVSYNFGVGSLPYYYLVLAGLLFTAAACHRLGNSRVGRAWTAIREDETAAQCMGIDVVRMKLLALGCGASIAGTAGCIFAAKQGTITPDSFDFILSVMVLAMVVLGGLGSIPGVMLGALILSVLPEMLRGVALYRMLLFGLVMVAIMRWRPQGLLGSVQIRRELAPTQNRCKVLGVKCQGISLTPHT